MTLRRRHTLHAPKPAPYGQAGQNIYDAEGRVLDAEGGVLGARNREIMADRNVNASKRVYYDAKGNAIDLAGNYLTSQLDDAKKKLAETYGIQAASKDVNAITQTAKVNQGRGASEWRRGAAGVAPTQEVLLPEGQTLDGAGLREAFSSSTPTKPRPYAASTSTNCASASTRPTTAWPS